MYHSTITYHLNNLRDNPYIPLAIASHRYRSDIFADIHSRTQGQTDGINWRNSTVNFVSLNSSSHLQFKLRFTSMKIFLGISLTLHF